jgi:hypothetical protein
MMKSANDSVPVSLVSYNLKYSYTKRGESVDFGMPSPHVAVLQSGDGRSTVCLHKHLLLINLESANMCFLLSVSVPRNPPFLILFVSKSAFLHNIAGSCVHCVSQFAFVIHLLVTLIYLAKLLLYLFGCRITQV